ncbi:hypothetical protein COEX109129_06715 [Corallococcus exiguus]
MRPGPVRRRQAAAHARASGITRTPGPMAMPSTHMRAEDANRASPARQGQRLMSPPPEPEPPEPEPPEPEPPELEPEPPEPKPLEPEPPEPEPPVLEPLPPGPQSPELPVLEPLLVPPPLEVPPVVELPPVLEPPVPWFVPAPDPPTLPEPVSDPAVSLELPTFVLPPIPGSIVPEPPVPIPSLFAVLHPAPTSSADTSVPSSTALNAFIACTSLTVPGGRSRNSSSGATDLGDGCEVGKALLR